MSNPAFGSPEWNAKYRKPKGQEVETAAETAAPGEEKEPTTKKKVAKKKGRGRTHPGPKDFISSAIKKPGALHKELGVPAGQKIPAAAIQSQASAPGKAGERARFALMLKKLHK